MDYVDDLIAAVGLAIGRLNGIAEDDAARRPGPGKWSAKEIVGHLVDSATVNRQRFVRAALQEDLVFPGYEQDAWVSVQQYQETPWSELVELWAVANRGLARVMRAIPEAARLAQRTRHNLHEIAYKTIPPDQLTTLDYFMRDYVDHLVHHLRQIDDLRLPGGESAKAVPEGASVLIPRLVCRDPAAAIDFCVSAFGAVERGRRPGPDGSIAHAMLTVGPAMLMIEAEWPSLPSRAPSPDGSSPVVVYVYVDDVDAAVARAVDLGARVLVPLQDQFWGDRIAWIMDPAGHVWTVASRIEVTTAGERAERWQSILEKKADA